MILIDKRAEQLAAFEERIKSWSTERPHAECDRLPELKMLDEAEAEIKRLRKELGEDEELELEGPQSEEADEGPGGSQSDGDVARGEEEQEEEEHVREEEEG